MADYTADSTSQAGTEYQPIKSCSDSIFRNHIYTRSMSIQCNVHYQYVLTAEPSQYLNRELDSGS